ncbi:uncharacterized protein BXZ73DRAFT_87163 [Epithele typhae]|uniref:uncharacterized protein n=1 Tax=Epithele typhae TaxID=378194 RepID=UPI00200735BF|nr:uncharacterized protein BXZ73DRAFT_87163 [Epithele typhae]KAH9944220.1 hypothetical protein BXZ73DRAFT_87163 [Epithele typhae]
MAQPELPVELWILILLHISSREPASLAAVVSCLSVSSITRAAALDRSVWHKLYRARYTHTLPANEKERHARLGSDAWHALFVERFKLDKTALRLVDHIRTHADDRQEPASRLVSDEMSFDVWDALELESHLPVPRVFREEAGEDMAPDELPALEHVLPRKFWAKTTLGTIARNHAVKVWNRRNLLEDLYSFEDVLAGLSAFVDESPFKIFKQLDDLAAKCQSQLDVQASTCDVPALAVLIRDFLRDEGFAVAENATFYHPLNQFPHFFLGPGRGKTIPISLVYTFSAICRRFNIAASSTNTRGRVLCHIASPGPHCADLLIDPGTTSAPVALPCPNALDALADPDHRSLAADELLAAPPAALLMRVVRNLMSSLGTEFSRTAVDWPTWARVQYATSTAFAALSAGEIHVVPQVTEDCALDCRAVLVDGLLPTLGEDRRAAFVEHLDRHVRWRDARTPESIFVGQVVLQPKDTFAVILGGENGSEHAVLSQDGIQVHRGAVADCSSSLPLKLETVRWSAKNLPMFDRFFEDAHISPTGGKRGRIVTTEELQFLYPDDLAASLDWAQQAS